MRVFSEYPVVRVVLAFSPLSGHQEPRAVALVLELAGNFMACAEVPGFDSLAHVKPLHDDSQEMPPSYQQRPFMTLRDVYGERWLTTEEFNEAIRQYVGDTTLADCRIDRSATHQALTATFTFVDRDEGGARLSIRPERGTVAMALTVCEPGSLDRMSRVIDGAFGGFGDPPA